jgi:hypothetical protein
LGKELENLFEDFIAHDIVANMEYRITRNRTKFTGGDRNTIPDFTGDAIVHITDPVTRRPIRNERVVGAHWFELKSSTGGIYLSSNAYQVEGHIDNLAREFAGTVLQYADQSFRPKLTLITTADVPFSPSIKLYSETNNVDYSHTVPSFRKNGNLLSHGKYSIFGIILSNLFNWYESNQPGVQNFADQ